MNKPYSQEITNYELNDLNNVSVSNSTNGRPLVYNGSNWVDTYPVSITTDINNLKIEDTVQKSIRIGKVETVDDNPFSISLGNYAGNCNMGPRSVSIGYSANGGGIGCNSVSIGYLASGIDNNNDSTFSLGNQAGSINQASSSTAVGYLAGYCNQHTRTIIVNATGVALNSEDTDRFYLKPVRTLNKGLGGNNGLYYNPTSGEITYSTN